MKRPTMLVEALLDQLAMDLDLSVERDKRVIVRRCEHEGLAFLTLTLPCLSDSLLFGIESGTFSCPTNFSRHGRLPRFLGGFFKRVFDKDGKLLSEPCPYAIAGIRQLCDFFKKLKIDCSSDREIAAIEAYREVEGELRTMTPQIERKDIFLDKIAGIIWAQVFPELDGLDLVCHHSRGFTADRRHSNERQRVELWNERSESSFPSDLHCYPNYEIAAENAGGSFGAKGVRFLPLTQELGVRVVFVPKTQKAPRVIAMEPSHVQFMQQSVKDYIYETLENHRLTKHSIRFTDQTVNQSLAYSSSIDKRLATLDLKDASDRVHLHLVQRIFKTSGLLPYLEDARSLHATLPDGRNMVLTKYASQGSALCFPVEAMVFYTLCQSAMHQLDGRRPSSRSIEKYSRLIDIYGDDIIVPVEYADCIVRNLESYALKVNVNKSFRFSHFRESCGADFYKGIPVRPVYARQIPHDNLRSWGPEEVMAWVSTADQFYLKGQWHICQIIRDLVRQVVRRPIPRSRTFGPGVAFFSYLFTTNLFWNKELQCWKQKRVQYQPIKRKDSIDGDEIACLNKWGSSVHARRQSGPGSYRDFGQCNLLHRPESRLFQGTESQCRVRQENSRVDARICDSGIRRLQVPQSDEKGNSDLILCVGVCSERCCNEACGGNPPEARVVRYRTYTELRRSGLDILPEPLDFMSSVKRGSFKSKCRWISLHS